MASIYASQKTQNSITVYIKGLQKDYTANDRDLNWWLNGKYHGVQYISGGIENTSNTKYTFYGLTPGTTYNIMAKITYSGGISEIDATATTYPAFPSISCSEETSNSVLVTLSSEGNVDKYYLKIINTSTGNAVLDKIVESSKIRVTELRASTTYRVEAYGIVTLDSGEDYYDPYFEHTSTNYFTTLDEDVDPPSSTLEPPTIGRPGEVCGYDETGDPIGSRSGFLTGGTVSQQSLGISPIICCNRHDVDYVKYRYRKKGSPSWEATGQIDDYYGDRGYYRFTVKNLDCCEIYEVQAQTWYGGESSDWSTSCDFEIGGAWCPILSNLNSNTYEVTYNLLKTSVDNLIQNNNIEINICFSAFYNNELYDEWSYHLNDTSIFSDQNSTFYILKQTLSPTQGSGNYGLKMFFKTKKGDNIYFPVLYDKDGYYELSNNQSWTATASGKPSKWRWQTAIASGDTITVNGREIHPVTATEWNNFTKRINEEYTYLGKTKYNFTTVEPGNYVKDPYNEAVAAIQGLGRGAGGLLTDIVTDTVLTPALFSLLASELNAAIENL